MKVESMAVNPNHPFSYSESLTPPNYLCNQCGANNCKLWRKYETPVDQQTLLCAQCSSEEQNIDISQIDENGTIPSGTDDNRLDQIGTRTPAIPTEKNHNFWSYASKPVEGLRWWKGLPTFSSKS